MYFFFYSSLISFNSLPVQHFFQMQLVNHDANAASHHLLTNVQVIFILLISFHFLLQLQLLQ